MIPSTPYFPISFRVLNRPSSSLSFIKVFIVIYIFLLRSFANLRIFLKSLMLKFSALFRAENSLSPKYTESAPALNAFTAFSKLPAGMDSSIMTEVYQITVKVNIIER